MKILIVVSQFNSMITEAMLEACLRGFEELGEKPQFIRVPGAMEIPLVIQDAIQKDRPDVAIALGCVIKGETDHYTSIASVVPHALTELSLKHHLPIISEVLLVDTYQKAEARIEKAYHAAKIAKDMVVLLQDPFAT